MPTSQREQALAHRAEAAEAEAAVVGLVLQRLEVGDDVALLLRREVAVGEGRHLLRAGEHRLVDVLRVDASGRARSRRAASRRRCLRSCGRRCSWSGRSGHRGRRPPRAPRPTGRPGCSPTRRGSPGRGRGTRRTPPAPRSPPRRRPAPWLGLRARLRHRHPAGADLEVDRGGADTDQRRADWSAVARLDALAVLAVAGRAADQEQLAALGDQLVVGLGRAAWRGRERGVERHRSAPGRAAARRARRAGGDGGAERRPAERFRRRTWGPRIRRGRAT